MGIGGLLHHLVAKKHFISKVEISFHEKESVQFVNVDDASFLFKDHLEARLPALGRESMGETQLDENSMDFREGRAVGGSLVVSKV